MHAHENTHATHFLKHIKAVCHLLSSDPLTLDELRAKLSEMGLDARAEAAPGSNAPGLVRMPLPSGVQLTLDDLAVEFGAYKGVPAMHRHRPLKYVFMVDDPELPYVCGLVAEKPRGEDHVSTVTLRRDIRL